MKKRGEVVSIGDLFSQYKDRFTPPQATVVKAFQEVMTELFALDIDTNKIKYTPYNRTIVVQISSVIKHEIQKKESEILKMMGKKVPKNSVPTKIF